MSEAAKIFDKTGREIMIGDLVKVFHFTGAQRKRHYMYKQAITAEPLGGKPYMQFSHVDLSTSFYDVQLDGSVLADYEIIKSIDCRFEERPRTAIRPALASASQQDSTP